MIKLEELAKDAQIEGLVPSEIVRLINIDDIGPNARVVAYRTAQGKLDEQTLFRSDEHRRAWPHRAAHGHLTPIRPVSAWRWRPIASVWRTCSTP